MLGEDVDIRILAVDETNWRVRPEKLIKHDPRATAAGR